MNGFLLDTNIPSELMRPGPEPEVQGWLAAQDIRMLFLSVVGIGEMEAGLTTLQDASCRGVWRHHWRATWPISFKGGSCR